MIDTAISSCIDGIGLISGKPSKAEVKPLSAGLGIIFEVNGVRIPSGEVYVVNTDRGVTLGNNGATVSIVEHFLAACAITECYDLCIKISGASELPILDGSAMPWVDFLNNEIKAADRSELKTDLLKISSPIYYQDPVSPRVEMIAFPSDKLKITYMVDFSHPDLKQRWISWDESQEKLETVIAPARTFGFVSELPVLQKRGLALGANMDNAIGLTDEGSYTCSLRFPDEPVYHKILDFIGDLMLCGLPIKQMKAHFVISCASHAAHIEFGKLLKTKSSIYQHRGLK